MQSVEPKSDQVTIFDDRGIWCNSFNPACDDMLTKKMRKKLAIALGLIGIYVALDGIGSIIVYPQQPLFFDHLMRLVRIGVGVLIIYVGTRVGYDY